MNDVVQHEEWILMKARKDGPKISYLIFAYGFLFSREASITQIKIVLDTLQMFYDMLGQKVNSMKLNIFFSHNILVDLRQEISNLSGFKQTFDLGMYLGIPLVHKKISKSMLDHIIHRGRINWQVGKLKAYLWQEGQFLPIQ